jgi:hypothetical protein
MENYGISKKTWLEEFLELPNGIPSDDTFRRVFQFIEPEVLNRCFFGWVETLVNSMGGEVIPIDGKTIRGSYDRNRGQSALHVISAWASEQRLVLGQMKVEDKSNEITAIPARVRASQSSFTKGVENSHHIIIIHRSLFDFLTKTTLQCFLLIKSVKCHPSLYGKITRTMT